MGMTLYTALQPKVAGLQINNDRVFLADLVGEAKGMESLCKELGVRSLSDFQSYDPQMLAEYIDDPQAKKEFIEKSPPIEWFNPADALPTLLALHAHYSKARFVQERGRGRKVGGKWQWEPLDRTDDLCDLETVLVEAQSNGSKFRIFIGE